MTLTFAALAWHRRWISDDGLIVVRTVRNLLAGHGPVFNAFERAEANTSTTWTWLLAAVGAVVPGDLALVAVVTGLVCAVASVVIAMDAARRLQRARGSLAALAPAGILIVLGAYPFWDFATSGLETGLCLLWLATGWWLLGWLTPQRNLGGQLLVVTVLGLGPLVRPDFALVSAVYLPAAWLIARPSWRRAAALLGAALALPVGYEIFRAGYYGLLVPLPALAKSASSANWERGLGYVVNFVWPHGLLIPAMLLLATAVIATRRGALSGRTLVLGLTPLLAAALLTLFVVRVGGDFMHGRMMLPPTFLALLPAAMLPLRRVTGPVLVLLAAWALASGSWRGDHGEGTTTAVIKDERRGYCWYTGSRHPVTSAHYRRAGGAVARAVAQAVAERRPQLFAESGGSFALDPSLQTSVAFVVGRLGMGGVVTPLDGIVVDTLGLANPIGARITMTYPDEPPGHQKGLPRAWVLADVGDPAADERNSIGMGSPAMIQAARHALRCEPLAELMASVRAPMTWDRFWRNLRGSLRRTQLVIPANAFAAERQFCAEPRSPDLALGATILASSSVEGSGWSTEAVVDGDPRSTLGRNGYSSQLGIATDHAEWLELRLLRPSVISRVVLHPRSDAGYVGQGFPRDVVIQLWIDRRWVQTVARTDLPPSDGSPLALSWPAATTERVRIEAPRLRPIGNDYLLQLAELELLP